LSGKDGYSLAEIFSPPLIWRTLFVVLGTVGGSKSLFCFDQARGRMIHPVRWPRI
jgi:hypothetical protein